MIVVDTSVWIDHLRSGDPELAVLLNAGIVYGHPLVAMEIALGSLKSRDLVLDLLDDLPQAPVASTNEVRTFIEGHTLYSRGIGYVDVSLLASCRLSPGTKIWTKDKKLAQAATDLAIAYSPKKN